MIFNFLLILNLFVFCVFGCDKYLAKNNKWRIPENSLFMLSFMGGSVGAVLGMLFFKHKISKPSFYFSLLFIIVLQVVGIWCFGLEGLIEILK